MNPNAEQLALRCLGHLQQEDAMLEESWEIVQRTRTALLERDQSRLPALLESQQATAVSAHRLRITREQLRTEIARTFDVPTEQASISFLARHTEGATRQRLLAYRARLTEVSRRVELVNRANASLAAQMVELLRTSLGVLTGVDPGNLCYERNGQMEASTDPVRSITSLG